jgi:hypothetical protein
MSSTSWSKSPRSPTRTAIPSPRGFRPAPCPGELLWPPLRRRSRSRDRGGRHHGVEGGLASLATAITAPGDVILAPNPSYPIHTFGFIIAGATIRAVPTTPDEPISRAEDRRCLHRAAPFGAGRELSVQPDRRDGGSGLLRAAGGLREEARAVGAERPGLFRALL